jgi:hypothetical protein
MKGYWRYPQSTQNPFYTPAEKSYSEESARVCLNASCFQRTSQSLP